MTLLTPWRRRPLAVAEASPLDQWFRDLIEENGSWPDLLPRRNMPRADVAMTDKDLLVTLELPGMDEKDVEIKLSGNQLVVSGERKERKEDKDKHYHRMETVYGAFERRFDLPDDVRCEADAVKATFHKGILEIRVPKVEPKPTARIPIKAV